MMHRRITEDDGRGVNEPLDELGKHINRYSNDIRLGRTWPQTVGHPPDDHRQLRKLPSRPQMAPIQQRPTQYRILLPCYINPIQTVPLFSPLLTSRITNNNPFNNVDLDYIKILARPHNASTICLRFHNMDEVNNRTVPTSLFQSSAFGTATITEMTLSFNQPKANMIKNKLNWNGQVYNNPAFINNDFLTESNKIRE